MIITTNDFQALDFNSVDIANLYFNDDLVWQKLFETTGVPPLTFTADGNNLVEWSIDGNLVQSGTPTTSSPIYPTECGDLVASGTYAGKYAIPITCGGETKTIYLDEPLRKIGDYQDTVSENGTVQRIITKIILDGSENWAVAADSLNRYFRIEYDSFYLRGNVGFCSHFIRTPITSTNTDIGFNILNPTSLGGNTAIPFRRSTSDDLASFKGWLSYQYNLGTPVTVYGVLAEPTTETITSPIIPTSAGINTLTVGTTLQPSSMTVKYHK